MQPPQPTHDSLSTCNRTRARGSPLLSRFSIIHACRNQHPTHSSRRDLKRVPADRSTNQRTDRQTNVNNRMAELSRTPQRRDIYAKPKCFGPVIISHVLAHFRTMTCLAGRRRSFIEADAALPVLAHKPRRVHRFFLAHPSSFRKLA